MTNRSNLKQPQELTIEQLERRAVQGAQRLTQVINRFNYDHPHQEAMQPVSEEKAAIRRQTQRTALLSAVRSMLVREGVSIVSSDSINYSTTSRERDEQVVVAKEARVVEEVVIDKDIQRRTETIQDTVRRTDVDVSEIQGQTRTSGYMTADSSSMLDLTGGMSLGGQDEGGVERNASRLGNAFEGATGLDIDRDGHVGQHDPRNNI